MKKIICLITVAVITLSILSGCSFKKKFTDYSFDFFDTSTVIIGYEKNQDIFNNNCIKIKERLRAYHNMFSIYDDCENVINLKVINDEAGDHYVKAESEITDMLLFAVSAYEMTGGKVNVAMGSVLSLWHKKREQALEGKAELPSMQELKKAAEHTNIYDMLVDDSQGAVHFTDKELSLDVGAVAKGFAAERIIQWMQSEGMTDYSLSIGGNVVVCGKRNWNVGIENPYVENEQEPFLEVLKLRNMSLVTSGSYQRFYTVSGKNYHHIIDPETLMPADRYISVSVLCESSAMADALSTALFCMDVDSGKALVDSMENTEAMWLTKDNQKLYSSGFEQYCK